MAEYNLKHLKQFDIDKVFIQKRTYKNIFTVLAKGSIDLNASSTSATNHCHGTRMTMLHSPIINALGSYTHQVLTNKCKLDLIFEKLIPFLNHTVNYKYLI